MRYKGCALFIFQLNPPQRRMSNGVLKRVEESGALELVLLDDPVEE